MFSFAYVLKATNCTFQEVDNIFCFAVGIAVYDEFFSSMCASEFRCVLAAFASHTSSRITFLTHHCMQIEGRCKHSPRYFSKFWVSWKPRRAVLWRFCTVLGVVVSLSSAHERCWINYWAKDGMWWQMTFWPVVRVLFFILVMSFLSIPLALLKQWLMLALL